MNNMTDLFTDTIDISTTILDMDSKLYLLAWDIAKGAIPLVKDSLSNTDCFYRVCMPESYSQTLFVHI